MLGLKYAAVACASLRSAQQSSGPSHALTCASSSCFFQVLEAPVEANISVPRSPSLATTHFSVGVDAVPDYTSLGGRFYSKFT